jgi:hypothetical protein
MGGLDLVQKTNRTALQKLRVHTTARGLHGDSLRFRR